MKRTWATAQGSGHPIAQLEGKPLVGAALEVMLGPQNHFGAYYFQITLKDKAGQMSQPFLLALHHSGPYPSYNWIEVIRLTRRILFPGERPLSQKWTWRSFSVTSRT